MQPAFFTARLHLRPPALADAPDIQRLAGEYDVAWNTGLIPHPYPDGAAEAWINSAAAGFSARACVNFAIIERDQQQFVGAIGLTFDRAHQQAELGYWMGKPYWGLGYCTEAALEMLRCAFAEPAFADHRTNKVWAGHFARNPASGKVLEKIGLQREGLLRQHFVKWGEPQDVLRYGILRAEWESSRAPL